MSKFNCCESAFTLSLYNCSNILSPCNKCKKYNSDGNMMCGSNDISSCYPIYLCTTPILLAADIIAMPFKCINYFSDNCCNLKYKETDDDDNTTNNNISNLAAQDKD